MFQIVLIAVIAYLAACYGYGMFLLYKLYRSRPTAVEMAAADRQRREAIAPAPAVAASDSTPAPAPAPAARAA